MRPILNNNPLYLHKKKIQLRTYLNHKRNFSIKNIAFLKIFENLLLQSDPYGLVCSCSIKDTFIYPCRYYLSFYHNLPVNFDIVLRFFRTISSTESAQLDFSQLNNIFTSSLQWDKVKFLIVGIDFREDTAQSRVKIYAGMQDHNDLLFHLFNIVGNEKIPQLIKHPQFMVGIDMFLNGKQDLKLYRKFTSHDLDIESNRNNLSSIFSDKIIKLIDSSFDLNVSCQKNSQHIGLNFQPKDLNAMVNEINNAALSKINCQIADKMDGKSRITEITLLDKEVDNQAINDINFYYYF